MASRNESTLPLPKYRCRARRYRCPAGLGYTRSIAPSSTTCWFAMASPRSIGAFVRPVAAHLAQGLSSVAGCTFAHDIRLPPARSPPPLDLVERAHNHDKSWLPP